MEFKIAKLDRIATGVSIFTTVLLVGMAVFYCIKVPYGLVFAMGMMLILIISYLLSPRRYIFEGSNLVIEKVIGKRNIITLAEVEAYTSIPDLTKLKVARTFGNGGLFGYYGIFSTAEYGEINCQLTSMRDLILIKTSKGNYALSPLEPAKFTDYLKTQVTGIKGNIEELKPFEPGTIKHASPVILLIPVFIFVLWILALGFIYPQLPERVAVHFDFNGNANGWSHPSSFIISTMIPMVVLLALSILIFFVVRQTTARSIIPNTLVIFFSVIQLIVFYALLDTYWFNMHGLHLLPPAYTLLGFIVLVVVLLYLYYRRIIRKT